MGKIRQRWLRLRNKLARGWGKKEEEKEKKGERLCFK